MSNGLLRVWRPWNAPNDLRGRGGARSGAGVVATAFGFRLEELHGKDAADRSRIGVAGRGASGETRDDAIPDTALTAWFALAVGQAVPFATLAST